MLKSNIQHFQSISISKLYASQVLNALGMKKVYRRDYVSDNIKMYLG